MNNDKQYFPPEVECFELKTEGVICASVTADPVSDPFSGLDEIVW